MKTLTTVCFSLIIAGCISKPSDVTVIKEFDLDRYLGVWYEIARLDHRFERGLSKVSATYSRRPSGGIDVLNKGFSNEKNKWKEATGRAYLIEENEEAALKVTFFWPFYGGYYVIDLDQDYRYAMVCGPSKKYLWILARTTSLEPSTLRRLTAKAKLLGFKTEDLIIVDHGN